MRAAIAMAGGKRSIPTPAVGLQREPAVASRGKPAKLSFEESVARIMGAAWPPPGGRGARAAEHAAGVIPDEAMLAALSVALGAASVPRVTEAEAALLDEAPDVP